MMRFARMQAAAELPAAEKLILESDCGHLAFQCEGKAVADAVREFFNEN